MAQSKNDVKLSKKLSSILRHNAINEGLCIKPNGFVAVEELLKKSLRGYTLEDIKRVVENNDKQRFTLRTDNNILEIRANQGHSIAVVNSVDLKVVDQPDFDIIHGTYYKYWPQIKAQGLSRMNRNHIHFAKGLNYKCGLRKNSEIFIYIDCNKARADGLMFYESTNGIILCPGNINGFIDKKYFLKVVNDKGHMLNFMEEPVIDH